MRQAEAELKRKREAKRGEEKERQGKRWRRCKCQKGFQAKGSKRAEVEEEVEVEVGEAEGEKMIGQRRGGRSSLEEGKGAEGEHKSSLVANWWPKASHQPAIWQLKCSPLQIEKGGPKGKVHWRVLLMALLVALLQTGVSGAAAGGELASSLANGEPLEEEEAPRWNASNYAGHRWGRRNVWRGRRQSGQIIGGANEARGWPKLELENGNENGEEEEQEENKELLASAASQRLQLLLDRLVPLVWGAEGGAEGGVHQAQGTRGDNEPEHEQVAAAASSGQKGAHSWTSGRPPPLGKPVEGRPQSLSGGGTRAPAGSPPSGKARPTRPGQRHSPAAHTHSQAERRPPPSSSTSTPSPSTRAPPADLWPQPELMQQSATSVQARPLRSSAPYDTPLGSAFSQTPPEAAHTDRQQLARWPANAPEAAPSYSGAADWWPPARSSAAQTVSLHANGLYYPPGESLAAAAQQHEQQQQLQKLQQLQQLQVLSAAHWPPGGSLVQRAGGMHAAGQWAPLAGLVQPQQQQQQLQQMQQMQQQQSPSKLLNFLVQNKASLASLIQLLPLLAQTLAALPRLFGGSSGPPTALGAPATAMGAPPSANGSGANGSSPADRQPQQLDKRTSSGSPSAPGQSQAPRPAPSGQQAPLGEQAGRLALGELLRNLVSGALAGGLEQRLAAQLGPSARPQAAVASSQQQQLGQLFQWLQTALLRQQQQQAKTPANPANHFQLIGQPQKPQVVEQQQQQQQLEHQGQSAGHLVSSLIVALAPLVGALQTSPRAQRVATLLAAPNWAQPNGHTAPQAPSRH